MVKKILIIDDSALMRSVLSDIINKDKELEVADVADNGQTALRLVSAGKYDCVVLDSIMTRMKGVEFLEHLSKAGIKANTIVTASPEEYDLEDTKKCMEYGVFDIVKLPSSFSEMKTDIFAEKLNAIIKQAANGNSRKKYISPGEIVFSPSVLSARKNKSKLIAIACSTGGPKALQEVIPYLPAGIDAPVLIVQHMPKDFTKSLAERLNMLSETVVMEAEEGYVLEKGKVYIAKGGKHMGVSVVQHGKHCISIIDDPPRVGLKPCADIMYETLCDCEYDEIICVVMTGMGSDATNGIKKLKEKKNIYVIAQDKQTATVYGMPRAIYEAGLTDKVVPLEEIAGAITQKTGVR